MIMPVMVAMGVFVGVAVPVVVGMSVHRRPTLFYELPPPQAP